VADVLPSVAPTKRENREQAIAKLLEGQRYVWTAGRLRSQSGSAAASRRAREAFQQAVDLDPTLAEGYTALAELAITGAGGDIDEAIRYANRAIEVRPDNYGSRRILARLYTFKSGLRGEKPDPEFSGKAIEQWKRITSIDPRNAEAWAFLSEFYERSGETEKRIEALKRWIASATPIESQFYTRFMGPDASLSPESAAMKLAPALIKAGRPREAVATLTGLIADDPDNEDAAIVLREAIDADPEPPTASTIESLQQAVFANPTNLELVGLLADVQTRAGKFDDAVAFLQSASKRLTGTNREAAAGIMLSLGDLFLNRDRYKDALDAYDEALKLRGLAGATMVGDDEREFVTVVFERIIRTLKNANRPTEVRATIERARKLLGRNDAFADQQLIAYYREVGMKPAALAAVRAARRRSPDDHTLLRLEATILAETGQVDQAVTLVRRAATGTSPSVTSKGSPGAASVTIARPVRDAFSDNLFISNLYSTAKRGPEAITAAKHAYALAIGAERRQIARLTLATAYQMSGDFKSAEETLRQILDEMPGNPIALNNLGYFLLERGDRYDEALKMIQEAVRIDPKNPSYLDSLGWAYFKLGRLAEAQKYLQSAARIDSGSAAIAEHLGDAYEKAGQPDLAKASWQRALNIASDAADVQRLRAKLKIESPVLPTSTKQKRPTRGRRPRK
jgi:tetratricopeptide (TPR) repeat protein